MNENANYLGGKGNFTIFAAHFKTGPIVQWIECKIPVLMIWVRIPVGSQLNFIIKSLLM